MLLLLCWIVAVGSIVVAIDLLIGTRSIRNLAESAPMAVGPMVSVIVAGRNEEQGIEAGVRSLLALDYSPLEVIAVNDRSTDGTGEVLERVRRDDPRLNVVHISTLPPGWLGKNHALAFGAARAKGDFLLFTDADVVFDATALGRAVRFMGEERIDHLAAFPGLRARGVALRALIVTFGMLFALHTRLWKARDPRSKRHIGIGAFNLIRASGYQRLGTHAAIALRPDDDLRLGREAKRAGLRQDIVRANSLLEIEWYASFGQMINGLMKNAFAGVHYSVPMLIVSTLALLITTALPWAVLLVGPDEARIPAAIAVVPMSVLVALQSRALKMSPGYLFLYPVGILVFVYIMWRAAILTLRRGGISWRDTSYPLSQLKRSAPAPRLDQTSTI